MSKRWIIANSPERIAEFKSEIVDHPAVTFKKAEDKVVDDATIYPGSKVSSSSGNAGTFGYRVKRNDVAGILTNQHVCEDTDAKVGSTVIGNVTKAVNSGKVDAAFIKITNSNYTPSNTINGTSISISSSVKTASVGTIVNTRGMKTGATKSGTIDSVNASHGGLTDLYRADCVCENGDSGAPVWIYNSSEEKRYTTAIHKGHNTATSKAYSIKFGNIATSLSVTRY